MSVHDEVIRVWRCDTCKVEERRHLAQGMPEGWVFEAGPWTTSVACPKCAPKNSPTPR